MVYDLNVYHFFCLSVFSFRPKTDRQSLDGEVSAVLLEMFSSARSPVLRQPCDEDIMQQILKAKDEHSTLSTELNKRLLEIAIDLHGLSADALEKHKVRASGAEGNKNVEVASHRKGENIMKRRINLQLEQQVQTHSRMDA